MMPLMVDVQEQLADAVEHPDETASAWLRAWHMICAYFANADPWERWLAGALVLFIGYLVWCRFGRRRG